LTRRTRIQLCGHLRKCPWHKQRQPHGKKKIPSHRDHLLAFAGRTGEWAPINRSETPCLMDPFMTMKVWVRVRLTIVG
jgi:hypothetical protein